MANNESKVQKELLKRLEAEFPGIYTRKIHQSMYSHNGIPDILFCLKGLFGMVEVKTDIGKPSKLQQRELKLISEAGGIALICYGLGDIEHVIQVLRSSAL